MARRKITQEAEEQASNTSGGADDNDRTPLTQRMPDDLVDDVDEFADSHGLSRNAAINFLVREALED